MSYGLGLTVGVDDIDSFVEYVVDSNIDSNF